jgi:hypothetical protein
MGGCALWNAASPLPIALTIDENLPGMLYGLLDAIRTVYLTLHIFLRPLH